MALEKLERQWETYPIVTLSLASYKGKDESSLKEYLSYQFKR
ncbi:MAG: hypothetical protein LUD17_12330 [Bacteroidales bacterium]|nr:hypothetical protein [Bacteroidales bacterium]